MANTWKSRGRTAGIVANPTVECAPSMVAAHIQEAAYAKPDGSTRRAYFT